MRWKGNGPYRGLYEADGEARQRDMAMRLARMMTYDGDHAKLRDQAENMRAIGYHARYDSWGPIRRFLEFRCRKPGRAWYRDALERGVIAPWWSRTHGAR